jgi:hypothetical protein
MMNDIDILTDCLQSSCGIYESYHQGIVAYISKLNIPNQVKERLRYLIQRDDYNDYEEIYSICVSYGIEMQIDDS